MASDGLRVERPRAEDARAILGLQDLFAREHMALGQAVYPELTLRDWELFLIGPEHLLDELDGRETWFEMVVAKRVPEFRSFDILKVTASGQDGKDRIVGYVMFERCKRAATAGQRRARSTSLSPGAKWIEMKQIFVHPDFRGRGCAVRLFEALRQVADRSGFAAMRLTVFEHNAGAIEWYSKRGFVIAGFSAHLVGGSLGGELCLCAHRELCWAPAGVPKLAALRELKPCLFRSEVLGEIVVIDYPDGSGTYEVKIIAYLETEKWHKVDSEGYSLWGGESFVDTIDVSDFFRRGHLKFRRPLSHVFRDRGRAARGRPGTRVVAKRRRSGGT